MTNYTFHALSDADFEDLSRDLLQEELGIRLEAFTSGRDSGIDLRYSSSRGERLIVQCKHYYRSGFTKLQRHLANDELPKIKALAPDRYILCTSVGLTPGNKDALLELLGPYCKSSGDILGCDDLNNLLGRHPAVEIRQHKLWLTSSALLERILHHATFFQTAMERSSIERRLGLYVQSQAYDEARAILQDHHYCIISGIPGIGKTTLAEILVVAHLEAGFELVVIGQNIREAFSVIKATQNQLFYYDDFLGRSSFGEKLEKNEDQNILQFLRELTGDASKRLILTTREYLLRQARQQYERLDTQELEIAKCIVDLHKYTWANRARIFYNHLYFSDLPRFFLHSFLATGTYRKIIYHPNYSPRVIEWMTKEINWSHLSPEEYASAFIANLDDPSQVWRHAFEQQLSPDARQILILLATLPLPTSYEVLVECATPAMLEAPQLPSSEYSLRLDKALRELDGSFLSTTRFGLVVLIEFHNPSIQEFLLQRLASNRNTCEVLLREARYFEQVERLAFLCENGRLDGSAPPVIRDSDALAAAAKRLLHCAPAGRSKPVDFGAYRSQVAIRHRSIALRIAHIDDWSRARHAPVLQDLVNALTERFIEEHQVTEELPRDLSQLAKVVYDAVGLRDSAGPITDLMETALLSFPDIDAWSDWGDLVTVYESGIGAEKVEYFRGQLKEFCKEEAQNILDNASTQDDVSDWSLRQVADKWGIDIDDTLHWLEEEARDLPPMRVDDTPVRAGGPDDVIAGDAGIDELFDSLRHMDRD
jgi:hypothetical protein